jgi:hypothetical protein
MRTINLILNTNPSPDGNGNPWLPGFGKQDCNKQQELAPENWKEQQKNEAKAFDTRLFKELYYTNRINGGLMGL